MSPEQQLGDAARGGILDSLRHDPLSPQMSERVRNAIDAGHPTIDIARALYVGLEGVLATYWVALQEGRLSSDDGDFFQIVGMLRYVRTCYQDRDRLQEFLEEIYQGETRVFLLGGTPLAWFRKLPAGGSFKADYERGAIGVPYEPSREDLAVVEAVAPYLRARGLHLVALDIIAGRLSDFNITSPGLLVETNEICGLRTERAVVEYLETILAEVREGSISAPV